MSLSVAGTAIETNINGRFKFTLHKNGALPPKLQDLNFPLLENANEYVVHGYTVNVSLHLGFSAVAWILCDTSADTVCVRACISAGRQMSVRCVCVSICAWSMPSLDLIVHL